MFHRTTVIAACVAAAISLAACGSSTKSPTTTSAGTPAPAQSRPAVSGRAGRPLVVGTICSCSGPQASLLADVGRSATAWADAVNATGGIKATPSG